MRHQFIKNIWDLDRYIIYQVCLRCGKIKGFYGSDGDEGSRSSFNLYQLPLDNSIRIWLEAKVKEKSTLDERHRCGACIKCGKKPQNNPFYHCYDCMRGK